MQEISRPGRSQMKQMRSLNYASSPFLCSAYPCIHGAKTELGEILCCFSSRSCCVIKSAGELEVEPT